MQVPGSSIEADFYSKRKFSLVNGIHTVLAFLTLINNRNDKIVLKYDKLDRDMQKVRLLILSQIQKRIRNMFILVGRGSVENCQNSRNNR